MSFQISKSPSRSFAKTRIGSFITYVISAFIISLQDMYIDTIAVINRFWMWLLVAGVRSASQLPYIGILRATDETGADITLCMMCYYACDQIFTCASLYRWLAKFGITSSKINLMFVSDGVVYYAVIDVDNDRELRTGTDLDNIQLADLKLCPVNFAHGIVKRDCINKKIENDQDSINEWMELRQIQT